jgi:hypothetical protein
MEPVRCAERPEETDVMYDTTYDDEVARLVLATYQGHGFVSTDKAGASHIDVAAVRDRVYRLMRDQHVVMDQKDLTKRAITQKELYMAVFPDGPGAHTPPTTDEEWDARAQVMRVLWNLTNTGIKGVCQQRAELEGETLILCESDVSRTYRSEETGKMNPPVAERGRYFTDNEELILAHGTLPRLLRFIKMASGIGQFNSMVGRRHPALTGAIARQIGVAMKQSKAFLGAPTTAKAAATDTTDSEVENELPL